jgi:hypothetical protein
VAGAAAALIASPIVLLPVMTVTTAVAFGVGTGLGTARGARAIRELDHIPRRLAP